jgi:hypothetical protein
MASPTALADKAFNYIILTNFLGVPHNDKKDYTRLVVEVLSYEINTIQMTVYVKNLFNIRMGTHGERWRNPIDW